MNWDILQARLLELFTYQEKNPIIFSNGHFLILFVIFLGIYTFLYDRINTRIAYLTLFSLFFYYKSSGAFVALFAGVIAFNFWAGKLLHRQQQHQGKLLSLMIIINLIPLFYYKYANFFIDNANALGAGILRIDNLILPVGISFFTFQCISYLADIYKKDIPPCDNPLDFAFYVSFFPQLVAGPIVRAKDFIEQIRRPIVYVDALPSDAAAQPVNYIARDDIGRGLFMIFTGFVKKAVIADYVGQYANLIYGTKIGESSIEAYSGFENLMAMYSYTLQIYCDFSGYSDMAIGISLLLGFRLLDNFRSPYQSLHITEFWRRWHISLSFWLRDYIYIALGGNRKGDFNRYLFLMITMLVGGFWHGADWKFVFWGGMHGAALIVHKLWANATDKFSWKNTWIWRGVSWFLTFHFVALLWVYFRALSFGDATTSILRIFSDWDLAFAQPFWEARQLLVILLLAGFGLHFVKMLDKRNLQHYFGVMPLFGKVIIFLLAIQLALQLQSADVAPFIYFQF